jgi:molecular chaperone GrpE
MTGESRRDQQAGKEPVRVTIASTGSEPEDAAAPDEAEGAAAAPDEREAAVEALARVSAERDEYLDALRRLKAEFDNFRKRVARDYEQLAARAHERLVKELLPVLDDLERALEAAAEHEEAKLEDGVRLVHRALADALAREGLVEVEVDGKFDPHTQEALLTQPSEEAEGTVIQVIQKGYRLGDRVLRPARVVVASPLQPGEEA